MGPTTSVSFFIQELHYISLVSGVRNFNSITALQNLEELNFIHPRDPDLSLIPLASCHNLKIVHRKWDYSDHDRFFQLMNLRPDIRYF